MLSSNRDVSAEAGGVVLAFCIPPMTHPVDHAEILWVAGEWNSYCYFIVRHIAIRNHNCPITECPHRVTTISVVTLYYGKLNLQNHPTNPYADSLSSWP